MSEYLDNPGAPGQSEPLKRSKWNKICPSCGGQVPSDAIKCRHCGELLDEPRGRRRTSYGRQPEPRKMSGCLIAIIVAAAAVPFIAIVAAIAIPNLLESKRAANEAAAISALRMLSSAEELYVTRYARYGTLQELAEAGMIDRVLANADTEGAPKSGYYFDVELGKEDEWSCTAIPAGTEFGSRSFYIDEMGIIRYESYSGFGDRLADENSMSLGGY